jgi:hypothetical protein
VKVDARSALQSLQRHRSLHRVTTKERSLLGLAARLESHPPW